MHTSKNNYKNAEEHSRNTCTDHPGNHDDSIEPGTPFPEPEVKPTIVSGTQTSSQVGVVGGGGTADDSTDGNASSS